MPTWDPLINAWPTAEGIKRLVYLSTNPQTWTWYASWGSGGPANYLDINDGRATYYTGLLQPVSSSVKLTSSIYGSKITLYGTFKILSSENGKTLSEVGVWAESKMRTLLFYCGTKLAAGGQPVVGTNDTVYFTMYFQALGGDWSEWQQ